MNKSKAFSIIFMEVKNIFILLFIPIFFTFVFGMVYKKVFIENIPMGVFDMDNSTTSRLIIKNFDQSGKFNVNYYAQSENELKYAIKAKKVSAGLIIPSNFGKDVNMMKSPKTLFLVDETNIILGNNALSYGSSILNTLNAGVQLKVLEGSSMIPYAAQKSISSMTFTERMLYDPQMSYMKYLFYGLAGIFVQQTYLTVITQILLKEKHKFDKINMISLKGVQSILFLILNIIFTVSFAFIGFTCAMYFAGKYFYLPLKANILDTMKLLAIFIADLTGMAFFISSVFESPTLCVQFPLYLSVPSMLLSGYMWPEYMMPAGFASIIKSVWPLIFFINPLRDMNLKSVGINVIAPYIQGGIRYAHIWIFIGITCYILKIFLYKVFTNPHENIRKKVFQIP